MSYHLIYDDGKAKVNTYSILRNKKICETAIRKLAQGQNIYSVKVLRSIVKEADVPNKYVVPYVSATKLTEQVIDANLRPEFVKLLANAGITPQVLIEKMKQGLDACEVKRAAFEGEFKDERKDVDYAERRQMLDMILKVLDLYPKEEIDVNMNSVQFVRMPEKKLPGAGANDQDNKA